MSWSLISNQPASTNGSTSFAITKPASVAAGDLLVAAIACPNFTPTGPGTFTMASNNVPMALYYRVADGTEGATFTWTSASTQNWAGGIACFRGVDKQKNFQAAAQQSGASTTAAFSLVLTTLGALVVALCGENSSPTAAITWPPSGYTSVFNQTNGGDMAAALAYKVNVTGAETPASVTVDAGVFTWRTVTGWFSRLTNHQASVV